MQSPEINELVTALSKAQGEFTAIPKGELNPFFKSKYAGLPDVILTAAPVLARNGLAVSQFITQNELGEDCLKTYLLHSSGQFIEHSMKMHLGKLDSQGQGSATTYARRYSYMSVLGLVADEDDDGNKASAGHATTRQATDNEGKTYDEPNDPRIGAILRAAEIGSNGFVNDIAGKFKQYGKLSEKQIESGFKQASKILGEQTTARPAPKTSSEPEPTPFNPDYSPEDERF